jgi:phosphate transport system substrate-binding protein
MKKLSLSFIFLLSLVLSWSGYASEGTLTLTTKPKEASVYVDGLLRTNITPVILKLPAGKHQIEVKKAGKQPEKLEVLIVEGKVISEEVILVDSSANQPPIEKKTVNLLKILNPLRGYFETTEQFQVRRQQQLDGFNQAVKQHEPIYQAAIAHLDKDNYNPFLGTLPVQIEWLPWAKRFSLADKSNIAILPEEAKLLWAEGLHKPVFLYFEPTKNDVVEVNKIVLVGIKQEWIINEISGYLLSVSVDNLTKLMTLWMEKYHNLYPNVHFQVLLEDFASLPAALTEGKSQLGLLDREMSDAEVKRFSSKYGYPPLGIRVAMTAIAVYVHESNLVKGLSIPQLDAIFSTTRKCGFPENLEVWGKLEFNKDWGQEFKKWVGLGGTDSQKKPAVEWNNLKIQLVGLKPGLTTYHFFKADALCGGEFKGTMNQEADGSSEVIKDVRTAVSKIGFAKLGVDMPGVRAVPLRNPKAGWFSASFIDPTPDKAMKGDYPLTRFLWLYMNKSPQAPLPPAVINKFLKLVLSEEGQKIAEKEGFIPLSADFIGDELSKLKQ